MDFGNHLLALTCSFSPKPTFTKELPDGMFNGVIRPQQQMIDSVSLQFCMERVNIQMARATMGDKIGICFCFSSSKKTTSRERNLRGVLKLYHRTVVTLSHQLQGR